MDVLTTCPHCFKRKNNTQKCPNCGYTTGNEKHTDAIKAFTLLENRYLIGNVLGRGGFGITYVAYDTFGEKLCAIKEYMPQEYAARDENSNYIRPTGSKSTDIFHHGKKRFIDEARTLYKLKTTHAVVRFENLLEANNTAYIVMEYLDGVNLKKFVNSYGGKISLNFANEVLVTVASTMMEIHKFGILHRDITPENIYITRDGNIKLIDFGAARNYITTQNNGMSVFLKPGYAPPEQYSSKGEQGKYTDVYAVAAVYYNILTGVKVPDALYRVRADEMKSLYEMGCGVSKKNSDAIDKALCLDYKKRFQNFDQFLSAMDFSTPGASKTSSSASVTPPVDRGYSPTIVPGENVNSGSSDSKPAITGGHDINNGSNTDGPKKLPTNPPIKPPSNYPVQPPVFTPPIYQPSIQPFGKKGVPCVTVISGQYSGRSMRLNKNVALRIGKQYRESDFIMDDADNSISRVHCSVRYDKKRKCFIIRDENSTNGTFFENGARLQPGREYILYPGEKFYLSRFSNMIQVMME